MKTVRSIHLVAALAITVGLGVGGCAEPDSTSTARKDSDLVSNSYKAAEYLMSQTPWLKEKHQPLLVATFVNINSLENSSALGRIVAEQVGARFAQEGFTVIEMKLRNNIFIKQDSGEFMLSRDVKEISQTHNAAAVITGTYAVGRHSVYINARLIRATDSLVLSGYDYSLPIGPDTRALLASQ